MTRLPVRCLGCGTICQPRPNQDGRCDRCYLMGQRLRNVVRHHYTGQWPTIRKALLAARPWCQACQATADLTVDHIVPVSRGGTHEGHNLQVLCRRCNSAKGAKSA